MISVRTESVHSDSDSDGDGGISDDFEVLEASDLPELDHFATLQLNEVPTTQGPGSILSDDASSNIDS